MLYFLVCMLSSAIGAISGIGGGVIIKPVLDAVSTLEISAIHFLSGNVVLCMAVSTLLRSRKSGVRIDRSTSAFLAVGACLGGVLGKQLFELMRGLFNTAQFLSILQSALLLLINIVVFCYIGYKQKIHTLHISSAFFCCLIGLFMGTLSAFLGIGGGPINIAVLSFFFSMKPKEAAFNSIYVIVFSQAASLLGTLCRGAVPAISMLTLVVMCLGGVCGSIVGSNISKKLSDENVDRLFSILLIILILLNIYNIARIQMTESLVAESGGALQAVIF